MSLSEEENQRLIEEFKSRDRVVRAISEDGFFRVAAIKNTKSANDAQKRHNLPYQAAFLMSRALASASLMSSFLKGEERITLEFVGDGLVNYVFAESMQVGEEKGFVEYNQELNSETIESISDLLGNGTLRVIRTLYDKKEPLTSVLELVKGDIATDLAYYYSQSEQIPTAVILDVDFNDDGSVKQSGGILVQALPGASEEDIQSLYDELSNIKSIISFYNEGLTPDKMLKQILPFKINLVNSTQIDFYCRCSKETFKDKLITLDSKEIEEMKSDNHNELVCRYCNEKYYLEDKDFTEILEEIAAKKN